MYPNGYDSPHTVVHSHRIDYWIGCWGEYLSRVANYIAFVQDNDVADERGDERAFILLYK